MPATTSYEFGDVVLVPVPYTDQSGSKKRPAVVVSGTSFNRRADIIVMAITTQFRQPRAGTVLIASWRQAGLIAPSLVKPTVMTINKTLVCKKLGQLKPVDSQALQRMVLQIFKP